MIFEQDLLMHCYGRLLQISKDVTRLLDAQSNLFTFDHVDNQIYLWRDPYIFQFKNYTSRPVWKVESVKDFNVVAGLLTILFKNGTISHNGTIVTIVDPCLYSRLPIFVAPDFESASSELDISYVILMIIVLILVLFVKIRCTIVKESSTESVKTPLIQLLPIKKPCQSI